MSLLENICDPLGHSSSSEVLISLNFSALRARRVRRRAAFLPGCSSRTAIDLSQCGHFICEPYEGSVILVACWFCGPGGGFRHRHQRLSNTGYPRWLDVTYPEPVAHRTVWHQAISSDQSSRSRLACADAAIMDSIIVRRANM